MLTKVFLDIINFNVQDTLQVCNSGKEEQSPFTGMLTNKLTNQSKEVTFQIFSSVNLKG